MLVVIKNIGRMAYRMTNHPQIASIVIKSRRYLICFSAIPRPFHQAKQAMHNVIQQQNAWKKMLSVSDVNVGRFSPGNTRAQYLLKKTKTKCTLLRRLPAIPLSTDHKWWTVAQRGLLLVSHYSSCFSPLLIPCADSSQKKILRRKGFIVLC